MYICVCDFVCDTEGPNPSPSLSASWTCRINYSDPPHTSCFDALLHLKAKSMALTIYGIKPLKPSAKINLPFDVFSQALSSKAENY